MDSISDSALKKLVNGFLGEQDNLAELSLKDLKKHIEEKLELPIGSIKGKDNVRLKEAVSKYVPKKKTAKQKEPASQATPRKAPGLAASREYSVTGKFSDREHAAILQTVKNYAEEHNFEMTDLTSFYGGEPGKKDTRHKVLWEALAALLPDRNPKVSRLQTNHQKSTSQYNITLCLRPSQHIKWPTVSSFDRPWARKVGPSPRRKKSDWPDW